jgi:hypothetical protein
MPMTKKITIVNNYIKNKFSKEYAWALILAMLVLKGEA